MRHTRIYLDASFKTGESVFLEARESHYLLHVLRSKVADPLMVFDGKGHAFLAEITAIQKKSVQVCIQEVVPSIPESPLSIHLGQAISRGEKMDYTLQKAVELGANTITPLFSARCGVQYPAARLENKMAHWQQIIVSACAQSGRDTLPHIFPPQSLSTWIAARQETCRLLLHPREARSLKTLSPPRGEVCLLVGPEGGFSEEEVSSAIQSGFETISLGPRILRTETAAPAAITALQCLWGDM
jgi:16S rRNA (uracil1498-N3)-methyltransferase